MAMEIGGAYGSYAGTYTRGTDCKKQISEGSAVTAKESGTSDYLAKLQKKNPKLNLLTGYGNGIPGSSNYPEKIDVTIASGFLAKMASDPGLAEKWEKTLSEIPAACKWGESMIHAMTGDTVYEFRFYIDENGNMSAGSVSGPAGKRALYERLRQQRKQQKEDFDRRMEKRRTEQGEKRKAEKEALKIHKVTISGNNVKSLAEKLAEANASFNSRTKSGQTEIDMKV